VDTTMLLKCYLCIFNGNINSPLEENIDNSNNVVIVKKRCPCARHGSMYGESIGIAPIILNLGTRWR
jgi:hypothetical protein